VVAPAAHPPNTSSGCCTHRTGGCHPDRCTCLTSDDGHADDRHVPATPMHGMPWRVGVGRWPCWIGFSDVWWQASRTDAQLVQVIRSGGKALGMSPLMPAFPGFSDAEAAALVATIRSLARPDRVVVRVSQPGQPNRFFTAPPKMVTAPLGSRVIVRAGKRSCETTAIAAATCSFTPPGTSP
jgi:hypothetical protein